MPPATLGSWIANRRKELGISQKELAARILREDDGKAISPQYLNDIEKDRRSPSSEHLMEKFAAALGEEVDYLFYLAGSIPDGLRTLPRDEAISMFKAFRRTQPK